MNPREIVQSYFDRGLRPVFWPAIGDLKGPTELGWINKTYTIDDYEEGMRVGLFHGVEIEPGKFVVDVDIDWGPGYQIAVTMLPYTGFAWGRESKRVSHCIFTTSELIPQYVYRDIGKSGATLIEFRSDRHQCMAPPTVWRKGDKEEQLAFVADKEISHIASAEFLQRGVCLGAIGMLLAKHLGRHGFGHDPRLAWAGFLLRENRVSPDELVKMGECISRYCENTEVADVRRVVESTVNALRQDNKRVKGEKALIQIIGDNGKAVVDRIKEWLNIDQDFERNDEGQIIKDRQANIRRAIRLLKVELSYNEFAEKALVSQDNKPVMQMNDRMLNSIYLQIDRDFRFKPTFSFYEMVVEDIAYDNAFHPVRNYLDTLTWDGESRIDHWLHTYAGAIDDAPDNHEGQTYLQAVSSIMLIAAVKRIRYPGCKFDEMVVLISTQGKDKSSGLRALATNDEWFSDDLPLNIESKEMIEHTLGKWIIEAADLVGGRKADRDHLKSMLSRQIDGPARMAYAHLPVERARQFIIVGTTNSSEFLADIQNRRFWPVSVEGFDVAGITRDRDQLWAEAAYRESKGEAVRLPRALYDEANTHQEKRRELDAWEDIISDEIDGLEVSKTGRQQISTDTLWKRLQIEPARRDRYGAKRISEIMQRLGFERTSVRENDRVQSGYVKFTSDGPRPAKFKGSVDAPF